MDAYTEDYGVAEEETELVEQDDSSKDFRVFVVDGRAGMCDAPAGGGAAGGGAGGTAAGSARTIAEQCPSTRVAFADAARDLRRQHPPSAAHAPVPLSIAEKPRQSGAA